MGTLFHSFKMAVLPIVYTVHFGEKHVEKYKLSNLQCRKQKNKSRKRMIENQTTELMHEDLPPSYALSTDAIFLAQAVC